MKTKFPKGWKCEPERGRMFSALEARLRPEIARRAWKAHAMGVADFDDAVQEGRVALLNVVARFDPDKGDLEHYARRALRNAFVSTVRNSRSRADKHAPLVVRRDTLDHYEGASFECERDAVSFDTPEKAMAEKELMQSLEARADKCNERERAFLTLSIEGWTKTEIRRRLGLTQTQGDWAVKTLRRRLNRFRTEAICYG